MVIVIIYNLWIYVLKVKKIVYICIYRFKKWYNEMKKWLNMLLNI